MAIKEYNFAKILKEYNKKYKKKWKIRSGIGKSTIIHELGKKDTFQIKYLDKDTISPILESLYNFIRYCVSPHIQESDIRSILYEKENQSLDLKIKIWPSSKIRYAYLETNYALPKTGHLGKSCMRCKNMQKALNFYIKNKTKIVVVVDNKNKIHARALLWDNVKDVHKKESFVYLDRVYARSDSFLPLFDKMVEENKWQRYIGNSIGNAKSGLYKDSLDITGIYYFPYTDTFQHLYYKDNIGIVSSAEFIIPSKIKQGDLKLYLVYNTNENSNGYFPELDPDRVKEVFTHKLISKKDSVLVKKYDAWVLKINIANIDGEYYSIYDSIIIKSKSDGFILNENSVDEVFTNDLIDKTKATQSDRYNGYIHKSNVIYIGDDVYHKLDNDIVCFDNKWYHVSQCFINYDRKELNKELAKQSLFSYTHLSERYMLYWKMSKLRDATDDKGKMKREGTPIPKELAITAYNLVYNSIVNSIEYQDVYCTRKEGVIQLVTGELIINSSENKKYLKKFNNKWYTKQTFKLGDITIVLEKAPSQFHKPNRNQLLLFK